MLTEGFHGFPQEEPRCYIKIDAGCFHPLQSQSLTHSTAYNLNYWPFKSPKYGEPGIVTRLLVGRPRRRGLIPGSNKIFSTLYNNETVVQADPASCPMGAVAAFTGE
jgi:hypothetical protein